MTALFRLVLRTQVTRGRAAALGAVGLLGMLLGFALGQADEADRVDAAYEFVDLFGLGLLVPVTALVFASAALGDPAEDGTLVYLWLRPVARWRLVLAALAASWCSSVGFSVVPTAAAAGLTGVGTELVAGAVAAGGLAAAVYCALFVGLGLIVKRSLVWGLAYVLIWEGFVARSGTSASRLSVLAYARSVLADAAGQPPPRLSPSVTVAIVVPVVVAAVAFALTTWALTRADVA